MTTETLWIVVAVVAAVLLIAIALGLVLGKRRRISLREAEVLERDVGPESQPPRRGGTYQAGSGFSFSSGTVAPPRPEPPAPRVEEPPGPAPGAPEVPPTAERPAPERDVTAPPADRPFAPAPESPERVVPDGPD
ncbi:MAG: signal recognition particle-docking protein FtsY, partial [Pseudonocardia sp.]